MVERQRKLHNLVDAWGCLAAKSKSTTFTTTNYLEWLHKKSTNMVPERNPQTAAVKTTITNVSSGQIRWKSDSLALYTICRFGKEKGKASKPTVKYGGRLLMLSVCFVVGGPGNFNGDWWHQELLGSRPF